MELVDFLRARLDEDDAAARAAATTERADTWATLPDSYGGVLDGTGNRSLAVGFGGVMAPETAIHIARHDPARVIAEVEAKRRLLDWLARKDDWALDNNLWTWDSDEALCLLALSYADHPDYRQEWRP